MHASVFQALGDPNRLLLLEALREGEQAVNDLAERLPIHQSGVSRHLRVLTGAGLVRMRPDGPRRLYALRPEPFQELDAWMAAFRRLWEGRLDRLEKALARRRASRSHHPPRREDER
jgi:DNA-binding transcriptional ArsR family regulator